MSLAHGGHLTHGSPSTYPASTSTKPYGVDAETETIDYEALRSLAHQHKPKMIVAGASAYPRRLDCRSGDRG